MGFARAWRPLDRDVAAVELRYPRAHLVEIIGKHSTLWAAAGPETGELTPQQRLSYRVGIASLQQP